MGLLYRRRNLISVPDFTAVPVAGGLVSLATTPKQFLDTPDWRTGARFSLKLISGILTDASAAAVSMESAALAVVSAAGGNPPFFIKPLTFGAITALADGMTFESTPIELDFQSLQLGGFQGAAPFLAQLFFVVNNSGGATTATFELGWLDLKYELYGGIDAAGQQ